MEKMVELRNHEQLLMENFSTNVFVNCPFDDDYRQLLLSLLFTIKYLGFTPRLSLEKLDAGTARLENIVDLIETSKFGIHDLSRILSTKKGEHARMNMPFEFGIDYACKKFKEGRCAEKKTLVLEKERYRYQAAISDLSGSDIKNHKDEPMELIKVVRDWFVTEELKTGPSRNKIWYAFNEFTSYLEEKLIEEGHEPEDFETTPIPEIMAYMNNWLASDLK